MTMLFDTFAVPRPQSRRGPLQIIQYDGPFKPKQASRRVSLKAPSREDKQRSDIAQHYKEDLLPTSRVVEVIDLTCLAGEGDPGTSGGERDGGDIPLDRLFPPIGKCDAEVNPILSTLASGLGEKGNKGPLQPTSCDDTTAAIEDSQAGSDIEECSSGLHEDDAELQKGDLPEVPTISTPEYHHAGSYIDTEDDTVSELDDSAKTSVGALQECTLSSTPPTSSSRVIEQPVQGRLLTIGISSSSSTDTDTDNDGNACSNTNPLTRKRKRSANIRMSNPKSRRPSKHITRTLKQQKLSTPRGRPTSNCTASRRPLSTLPYSDYATGNCSSDDSSDDDSENRAHSVSSKGNSQGNVVVIDDSQSDSEADSGDPYEEDPALHMDDRLESPGTSIPENCSREVPTVTIDKINSDTGDGALASELKQIALPSTSKSPSMVIKQSVHGRLPTIDITSSSSSSSSSDSDSDSNDRKGNHTTLHYQKRSPPAQGHIKKPNTTSNQPFKHNALPAMRRKPRGQKRKRSQNNEEEEEYEVENILDSRIYHKKLQYRAKWLGYPEDDPVWYDARNFKNSPHSLREFYKANPFLPGPPERLRIWAQCWEDDRDAEDHPDDNKPKRLSARGGEL